MDRKEGERRGWIGMRERDKEMNGKGDMKMKVECSKGIGEK